MRECTPDEIQQEYRSRMLSERSFADYLQGANNYYVRSFTKIRYFIPDTSTEYETEFEPRADNRNYFYPDLLLIDHNSSIVIDIEIDEPYSIKDGTPIHYVCTNEDEDGYAYTAKEEYRNRYLAGKGIIVVRFAEEQVVKYPNECLYLLSQIVVKAINYNGKTPIDFNDCLTNWVEEMNVCRWTENEAIVMAENKHRKTYLPNTETPTESILWTPKENTISMVELAKLIKADVQSAVKDVNKSEKRKPF